MDLDVKEFNNFTYLFYLEGLSWYRLVAWMSRLVKSIIKSLNRTSLINRKARSSNPSSSKFLNRFYSLTDRGIEIQTIEIDSIDIALSIYESIYRLSVFNYISPIYCSTGTAYYI